MLSLLLQQRRLPTFSVTAAATATTGTAFLPPSTTTPTTRAFSSSSSSASAAVAAAKRRQLLRRHAQGTVADPTAPLAGSVKLYQRHVVVLDPVRGHTRWPTHVEESGFFQVAHYVQARKALEKKKDGRGGEESHYYRLKVTVAEALGHPWAAPQDDQDPATTYPERHSVLVFGPPRGGGLAVRGVRREDVPLLVEALATADDYERALTVCKCVCVIQFCFLFGGGEGWGVSCM
jgi:hypothetical protein